MRKQIFGFIIIIFLYSCKNEKVEYYSDGNIKKKYFIQNNKLDGEYEEYYKNGKVKLKHIYLNGELKDSSIHYDENGKISQLDYHRKKGFDYIKVYNKDKISHQGTFYNNQKYGRWKYFDSNGKLKKVIEYIDSCGTQYTNQGWSYDSNEKFIEKGSNYYSVKTEKNKFKINETIDLKIKYAPLFDKKSISFICISPEIERNYCNLKEEKLDTIFSEDQNFDIKLSFSKKGNKTIRGFIREVYFDKNKGMTGVRSVFINIPFLIEE